MKKLILFLLIISVNISFAQYYSLKGKIRDKNSGDGLIYANIRAAESLVGTSTNAEGYFELKLLPGKYTLISSFIGYISDTVTVSIANNESIDISLTPVPIKLPEVTVVPGLNPAIRIIKNAIEFKNQRTEKLNSYTFTAYTKGAIRTNQNMSAGNNSLSIGLGGSDDSDSVNSSDSSKLQINGILENQSKGYYKKPNNYKEEIIARKQSANFPSSVNLLTGGRLVQNFYTEDIQFFDRPLPSPLSNSALDYYYFYIADSLAMDNEKVYKIFFEPEEEFYPGFTGFIYILDSTFALLKVDVSLNKAANIAGIFTKINIFQQYLPYENDIYMPIDYRLFIEANILGLAKFGFDLNSIMYNYSINKEISDDFFDMAVLTVMPEADKKDSLYWQNVQTIPNTIEEITAYKKIDSINAIPVTFWDNFSFLSTMIGFNDNFSISGPLSIYGFNVVEGHSVNMGLFAYDLLDKRFNGSINMGYGFSDKRVKTDFRSEYFMGKYRTHKFELSIYNKNEILFSETDDYNNLTSTITSLFGKYDFRNYFGRKGFKTSFSSLVFPVLTLGLGYFNNTDISLSNKTDFSFFNKEKKFADNKSIFDTRINALTAMFQFDFRNYIEDGLYIRRVNRTNFYTVIDGDITFSNSKTLKSNVNFNIYKLNMYGRLNTFKSAQLFFNVTGVTSSGNVPIQYLYALPGNLEGSGKDFSFRSLGVGEVYGDRVLTVGLEHSFKDELFKMAHIPYFKNSDLNLSAYINAAWLDIRSNKQMFMIKEPTKFISPFYEAGFSIGHPLFPLTFEFTWKLNYKGVNNFTFGINTVLL
ncbi:MAG: DUF5686 family protein [bacterium]